MRFLTALLAGVIFSPLADAAPPRDSLATVLSTTWPSQVTAPPVDAKHLAGGKATLGLVQLAVASTSEKDLVAVASIGGVALGLPSDPAEQLQRLLVERYASMAKNPTFRDAPSALRYCYSAEQPPHGMATCYVPSDVNSDTEVVLFLHGFGGSFLYTLHELATVFPDRIIVAPAFGISCAQISQPYINECLESVAKKLEIKLRQPLLIGLSAGGFGAFDRYVDRPTAYESLICLAAFPSDYARGRLPEKGRIRLMAGARESFVTDGRLAVCVSDLNRRVADFEYTTIANGGHFFLLTHPEATRAKLHIWAR